MGKLSVVFVILVVVPVVYAQLTRDQILQIVQAGIPKTIDERHRLQQNQRRLSFGQSRSLFGQSRPPIGRSRPRTFPGRPTSRRQPINFPRNRNQFQTRRAFSVFGQQNIFGFRSNHGGRVLSQKPNQSNVRNSFNPFVNVRSNPISGGLPKARLPSRLIPVTRLPTQFIPVTQPRTQLIPVTSAPQFNPQSSLSNGASLTCPQMKDHSAKYRISSNSEGYPIDMINKEMANNSFVKSKYFTEVLPVESSSLDHSATMTQACPSHKTRLWSYMGDGGKCWLIDLLQDNVYYVDCMPSDKCSKCGTDSTVQKKCIKNYQYMIVWSYCDHMPEGSRIKRERIVIPTHCGCAYITCT